MAQSERRWLNSWCFLCAKCPVTYIKTKGGFHKACAVCCGVLDKAGLLIEPEKVFAMNHEKMAIEEAPNAD